MHWTPNETTTTVGKTHDGCLMVQLPLPGYPTTSGTWARLDTPQCIVFRCVALRREPCGLERPTALLSYCITQHSPGTSGEMLKLAHKVAGKVIKELSVCPSSINPRETSPMLAL